MRACRCLLSGVALAVPASTQLAPGELLAAVRTPVPIAPFPSSAMHQASLDSGVTTQLTIPTSLATEGVGALVMTTPATGFLATAPTATRGTVRAFTLAGTVVTDTVWNTQPMPGRKVRQLAIAGADLWFVCTDPNDSHGFLGRLPVVGGAPTVVVDWSLVPAYRGSQVAGLLVLGSSALVATANGGTSPNHASQLFRVALQPPHAVTHLADLPLSRFAAGNHRISVSALQVDPVRPNTVVVCGRDGDLVRCDATSGALVDHRWFVAQSPGTIDSMVGDPVSGDLLCGVTGGRLDLAVLTHRGVELVDGLRLGPGNTFEAVTAQCLRPHPAGRYHAFLPGCPGSTLVEPTSRGVSAPVAGNPVWAFELRAAAGYPALLLIGRSNQSYAGVPLPLGLAPIGLPLCQLGTSVDLVLVGDSFGRVHVPLPLGIAGLPLYTQWLTLGPILTIDALSDARVLFPG